MSDETEYFKDLKQYHKAMAENDSCTCIGIEQKYELYGYPPEIVTHALLEADKGKDMCLAIDEYIDG